jgi:hypothetical protein
MKRPQMPLDVLIPGVVVRLQTILLVVLGLALAACAELQQTQTGIEPSVREQIDTCLQSCERDHSICMESIPAQRSSGSSFGAAQECDRGLSACFNLCRDLSKQSKGF